MPICCAERVMATTQGWVRRRSTEWRKTDLNLLGTAENDQVACIEKPRSATVGTEGTDPLAAEAPMSALSSNSPTMRARSRFFQPGVEGGAHMGILAGQEQGKGSGSRKFPLLLLRDAGRGGS